MEVLLPAYALLAVTGTLGSILIGNFKELFSETRRLTRVAAMLIFGATWLLVWLHPVLLVAHEIQMLTESFDPNEPTSSEHTSLVWHLYALLAVGIGYFALISSATLMPKDRFSD